MNMYTLVGALIGSFLSLFMTGTYTEIVQNQDWLAVCDGSLRWNRSLFVGICLQEDRTEQSLPVSILLDPDFVFDGMDVFGEALSQIIPGSCSSLQEDFWSSSMTEKLNIKP